MKAEASPRGSAGRAGLVGVLLKMVQAHSNAMNVTNWYADGAWSWEVARSQDYLLGLQWLVDNAPNATSKQFVLSHALLVKRRYDSTGWEEFFHTTVVPPPSKMMPENTTCPHDKYGNHGWQATRGLGHGVNLAQAIKSASVVWRFSAGSGNDTLVALAHERMETLKRSYGVATGLTCADEFLCNMPTMPEHCRKSPSRGTELCAIVESMFSFNEMFSIHGDVLFADRAERIAFNALPGAWASPSGGEMWSHQGFSAVNQVKALNTSHRDNGPLVNGSVVHHIHDYGDPFPNEESFLGGPGSMADCCTANNGQGWPKLALRVVSLKSRFMQLPFTQLPVHH
jgi:hypothetical protein